MAKKKFLRDGLEEDRYVRCWAEGRGRKKEFIVQIWNSGKPEGDPDGDWAMPSLIGEEASVAQALLQTPK